MTAASTRRLRGNHQGSIVAVADNAGAPIAINAYDEWGIPAATNVGRFQYTGQIWLPELGLYYYKARIYSPTLGRFMQTDPIGYEGGIGLYAYAYNDPINLSDSTGQRPGDRYRTLDEAGSQAIRDINATSIEVNREYGGTIYKNWDGSYSYTAPIKGDGGEIDLAPTRSIFRNEVADYHTHGGVDPKYESEPFSPADKNINVANREPGFLGTPSGQIKKFDPNKTNDPKTRAIDEREKIIGNTNDGITIVEIPRNTFCSPGNFCK